MKFWFGQKKAADPVKETTPEPPKPLAEAATVQIVTEPPPLGAPSPSDADATQDKNNQPLQPATSLVRPQTNQKVLYYQLMNGLYDAVMIMDDNGHIVDCNERVNTVLGYTRDEMWDMPVNAVVKGIGPQIFQQMKDALHSNHQVLINAKCTRKDGQTFQGEVGVCIMHLTRGENLVFTVRNVEKRIANIREQILKEMSATQRLKPKPVATVRVVSRPGAATPPDANSTPSTPSAPAEKPRMVLKKVDAH